MFFSVVIPTYNRLPLLTKVIAALQNQVNAPEFEIIVVDDGSEEAVRNKIAEIPGVQKIFQQNSGPAVARNKGVAAAKGDYIVFIGDDTVPEPDFLSQHASFHKEAKYEEMFACLGYTKWPAEYHVTRFMKHINNYGAQFGYKLIKHGAFVRFNFFYTSNISLSRTLLVKYPFDTSFPAAAWEDIELGYRLSQLGLKIRYNAKAITNHYHPMDIKSFSKRQFTVGRSAVFFYQKHPELKGMLGIDGIPKFHPIFGMTKVFIEFQIWLSQLVPFFKAKSAYNAVIRESYMKGLIEAMSK